MLAYGAGLEPFVSYHGQWCGRAFRHSYQDLVVFTHTPRLADGFDALGYLGANPDLPFTNDLEGLRQAVAGI